MSKYELHQTSEQMKLQEDAIYEKYKEQTRNLLVRLNAEDLLPMLGLDDASNS
jgi:hypothetical protein